jgi:hypothetical protein
MSQQTRTIVPTIRNRSFAVGATLALVGVVVGACTTDRDPAAVTAPARGGGSPSYASSPGGTKIVNVSDDTTAQNETPIAVNPVNPLNLLAGNNDWNFNDGCGVNVSFDGGKTWTKTLPSGFIPAITRFTNDPAVPGTGI